MAENQATSSKRTRVDSTAPSATLPKRPRADDVEHLSHISEFHSAILLQQMERGWRMNEANQRLLLELKPSLAPADLHSHICSLALHTKPAVFSPVDENRYYLQPEDTIKTIRGLWPTVLVASNARGRPAPPSSNLASNQHHAQSFANPIVLQDNTTAHLFRALMHTPRRIDGAAAVSYESKGEGRRWCLMESVKNDILSRAQEIAGPRFKFTSELQRLLILASQDSLNGHAAPSKRVPHALVYEISAFAHLPSFRLELNQSFKSKQEVLDMAASVENKLGIALGCVDFALLRALDACALLGGRELPRWPPQPHWRGAYVDRHSCEQLVGSPNESSRRVLALIRQFERWGVPLWCFVYFRPGFRLDVEEDGRPTQSEGDERLHQKLLQALSLKKDQRGIECSDVLSVVRREETDASSPADTPSLPTGARRSALEDAILRFLDHQHPGYSTWAQFSEVVGSLLGTSIWTDKRHEDRLHPGQFVSGEHETWSRIRDGMDDCLHTGVLLSGLEVPPPWYSSSSHGISMYGRGNLASSRAGDLGVGLEPVALGLWHVLRVDDFTLELKEAAITLQKEMVQRGVYGWSFAQSNVAFKDAEGRSIPRSRYVLNLVFKLPDELKTVALELQLSHPNNDQTPSARSQLDLGALGVYDWEKHPRFVDVAFAKSTDLSSRNQLLRLAPSYPIPNSGSADSDARNLAIKRFIHFMRYEDLFETSTFPPLEAPSRPAALPSLSSSSPASVPSERSRDMSKCSLETLLNIAFSARAGDDLTFLEVIRMQRLACILFCLSEQRPPFFLARIFRSDGPYLKIMRYIGNSIRANPQLSGSLYIARASRPALSPFHEGIRLNPGGSVELFLDLDSSESSILIPSREELQAYWLYVADLGDKFEQKLSRAQKRNKKRHGAFVNAAGPSRTTE